MQANSESRTLSQNIATTLTAAQHWLCDVDEKDENLVQAEAKLAEPRTSLAERHAALQVCLLACPLKPLFTDC
jgi:hypothetical protein